MSGNKIKPNQKRRRPTGIKVLSIFLFLVSLFYLLKLSQVLLQWPSLEELPLTITPFYLAADSSIWLVSGILMVWGLWKGKCWSRTATQVLSLVYSLAFWADRIWIAEPETLAQRWPINLLLTIVGLAIVGLILNRKSSRDYLA